MTIPLLLGLAFVSGSIPTGLLLARSRGIDLRSIGSGNIGATNVLRAMGKGSALLTFLGDFLKGLLPVLLAGVLETGALVEGFVGIAAILGHNFSIFLNFRGGKGVATSFGVLSIYSPIVALITAIIWLVTVVLMRYSSLGALISFGAMPFLIGLLDAGEKLPIAICIAVLLFLRHMDNIRRLLQGTEKRIGRST